MNYYITNEEIKLQKYEAELEYNEKAEMNLIKIYPLEI